jgi:hypothetical protein
MTVQKGKPLKLLTGSIVLPSEEGGSKVMKKEEIDAEIEQKVLAAEIDALLEKPYDNEHAVTVRRSLADVPTDLSKMNVFMLVIAYRMWGLDSFAISKLLNVTPDHVEALEQHDVAMQVKQELIDSFRHAEASTVHGYIARHTMAAATTIAAGLKSRSEDNRLTAAKDLLDRGGFRPVDKIEHTHRFEDELRIRFVTETEVPTLDLTVEK